MMTKIDENITAAYAVGDYDLLLDCNRPADISTGEHPSAVRVKIGRASIPGLLRVIMGGRDYERTVAPRLPAGIDPPSSDALRAAWGGPTTPARSAIDDTEHDERTLWRALAIASARGGNSPFAAAREATMVLAEYRKMFGPPLSDDPPFRYGDGEGVKP